jgi:hypothetical protein
MAAKPRDPLKILFIGNSFTARNDVPGLIARLAQARGRAQEHRLISMGGASLRMHWNKGEAPREIERGRYDYVVLQEQSTLPVKNAERMKENVRLFDEAIRGAGAKRPSRSARSPTPTPPSARSWARRSCPWVSRGRISAANTTSLTSTTKTEATPAWPARTWPHVYSSPCSTRRTRPVSTGCQTTCARTTRSCSSAQRATSRRSDTILTEH